MSDDAVVYIFGQLQIRILDTGMMTFQFNLFLDNDIISISFI